ncbi:PP2C family protein-serine/threonine phosphatase [Pseudonocardia sp. N23]|uniref:PP2C family protein-serine/threonine phosphatase n=1 Tax=Pseudonocardia sp. N23 TaxID=1987376 RepID=UPI000C02644A|nr:PP2C family protein-serine/threonine phosphatase [Pseudonocardia sp. N23]GAY07434.1 serine phosphatase RsbU, regulator of sigma subunit [Pseudonocardia sp. N23]
MISRSKDADMDRAATGLGGGAVDGALPVQGSAVVPAPPARPAAPPGPSLAERLLDGIAEGVVACDAHGIVRSANTTAVRMLPDLRVGELSVAAMQVLRTAVADAPDADADAELALDGRAIAVRRRSQPGGWTAWHLRDVTEERARLDSLLAERARSRFLAAASSRLGLSLHPGRTARAVAELAADELADAAVVVLPVHGGTVDWYRCEHDGPSSVGRASARDLPGPVARALAGLDTGPQLLLADELDAEPWRRTGAGVSGAALMALPGNGKPAGVLVLLRSGAGDGATAASGGPDVELVEEFAQRAGIALAAASLYAGQARTAAVLKRSLLQPDLPLVEGVALGAAYRPAEQGMLIGGDFYDVHPDPAGRGATFMLGDVCGKGVGAAVSTGRLRHSVQALRRLETDPVRLLDLLNDTMLESTAADDDPGFATVVIGTAVPLESGGLRLRLAGGGHPPPVLVRTDGVETVEIGGTLVGAIPSARFRSRTVDLAPGESCVLYTDGVTEARGGIDGREEYGETRLTDLLVGCHVMPAAAIAERVTLHASRWNSAGARDDVAVLVVQAPLHAAPQGASRRHLHSVRAAESPAGGEEGTA